MKSDLETDQNSRPFWDQLFATFEVNPDIEVPIRSSFIEGSLSHLSLLVRPGDSSALDLYLLAIALGRRSPNQSIVLPASTWAVALGLDPGRPALNTISRTWMRLEHLGLVQRHRQGRRLRIVLLREDGSGRPYIHPASVEPQERYLKLPIVYWTAQWSRHLALPAKAMLLIALSLPDRFVLPNNKAPSWYGLSPNTAQRGLKQLTDSCIIESTVLLKRAPNSPTGITKVLYYTLSEPFGPRGKHSNAWETRVQQGWLNPSSS
jgi:hypothetical protein